MGHCAAQRRLAAALNNTTPQIFDSIMEDGVEKRVLNSEGTEATKQKLARIKEAFTGWIWTAPTGWRVFTTTGSTTSCRAISTSGI
jgi:N12 class adenine-specific DNA methylase